MQFETEEVAPSHCKVRQKHYHMEQIAWKLEHIRLSREFSREYGTFLGIAWVVTFLLFVVGLVANNFIASMLGSMLMIASPIFALYLSWRFKQLLEAGDNVSWGIAWVFVSFTLLYANFLLGAAAYVYFQFFDEGRVCEAFYAMLTHPDIIAQYKQMGMSDILENSKAQLDIVAQLSPFDLAMNLFADNLIFSFFLGIPMLIIAHRKSRNIKKEVEKLQNKNDEQEQK